MRFSYDPQHNIAYIRFQNRQAEVESIRVSDELIVDMAPDGTIYGIELLNANEQLTREEANVFEVINQETVHRLEFPLVLEG